MNTLMVYPMFGLFALSGILFLALFRARAGAVARGEIKYTHYLTYSTDQQETQQTLALSRHFTNLFETPLLFYSVCLAIMITNATNPLLLSIAWLYVACRYVHAYVHTGSNNLRWRIGAYFASWLSLAALWLGLLLQINR